MAANPKIEAGLPPAGDKHTLYIVDISGYVFRAYHALPPLNSSRGEPTHAVLGVASMLLKLVNRNKPALLAVAMDSRIKSFRHDLYGAYKANRPPAPPDLRQQMARVGQIVEAFPIAVFQQDGMEADDVIATVVRRARAADLSVVMVSADKDLLQLVDERVRMLDTMRDAVFGPREAEEKLGVPPSRARDLLALVGDSSDNVPGVPSVGPKTAAALLSEFGDLENIYRNLDKISRESLRAKLREHKEQVFLSRRLVTLRDDVDIEFDPQKLAFSGNPSPRLIELFKELEFTRLLAQLQAAVAAPAEGPAPGPSPLAGEGRVRGKTAQLSFPARTPKQIDQLLAELRGAGRVGLYSVISGERAADADLLGLAFAWAGHGRAAKRESKNGPQVGYVPIGKAGGELESDLDAKTALAALRPFLEDPSAPKVCADAKRDTLALLARDVELRGIAFDTAVASYLLDPERRAHTIEYLAGAELGWEPPQPAEQLSLNGRERGTGSRTRAPAAAGQAVKLAQAALGCAEKLGPRLVEAGCDQLMREVELPLSRVLAEMEATGIRVDAGRLKSLSGQIDKQITGLEARCIELAGREFNVASPRQLEAILFDELKLPVIKKTKSARSTDRDALEELAIFHDLPAAVLEYRSLAKLKNTYLDTLPEQISPRTGRIHTEFHQTVTATGRLSSSNPNLQNIPIRTELGREIRDAFIAREGWLILSADYSQIELRILAHLSRDPELRDAFVSGQDVHAHTAQAIFGVSEAEVTRQMRGQAKTVNYAVIYGQTEFALARNLRIERSRAAGYIKAFFERYSGVKAYLDDVVAEARRTGYVRTALGRRRALPDLNSGNRAARQQAERMARNTPIQGTAADIIKLAMVEIFREMRRRDMQSKMLLTVHDELVFEAPPGEKQELGDLVRDKMQRAMRLDVPLVVDRGWGKGWGEAH